MPEPAREHFGPQLTALIAYVTVVCRMPRVQRFCRDALAEPARLFRLWHKFRGGRIDHGQLFLRSIPI